MATEEAVRPGRARSWVGVAILLGVLVLVWFLLSLPGCGSGSTGIGRL
jgi:hypothetical protein